MSLDADLLLDRRRLKRRLNLWRVLAVVGFTVAVLVAVVPRLGRGGQHIARVNINGLITENTRTIDAIVALAKDRSVPAVIVSINSPGGTVGGGETLRAALLRVAAVKPVVAVMNGTAASAAYMAALPATRIFAREGTLTGSIGVILETGEVSGLLGKLGVAAEAITSGPLKGQPSFTQPLTPAGRTYLHGLVDDMYDQFVTMVAVGRHMDPARVRELADGRAYTGRQALALGLVDQIGGEIEARSWLFQEKQIPESLPVRDISRGSLMERATGSAISGLFDAMAASVFGVRPLPAGAWALWQGSSTQ